MGIPMSTTIGKDNLDRIIDCIRAAGPAGIKRRDVGIALNLDDALITTAVWQIGTDGNSPIRRPMMGWYVATEHAAAFAAASVAVDAENGAKPAKPPIGVGSMEHQVLLACRGGGMSPSQLFERWDAHGRQTAAHLARRGLLTPPAGGSYDGVYTLTPAGRDLVAPDGPLSRRKSLTTYCQL